MDQQPVETTVYSLSDTPPLAPERRAGERYLSLFRVGTLTIGDRRELCLIKNVSSGGMMIRPYCPIEIGTHVSVELKQGEPVHGKALWDKDDCIGITFDEPIDVLALLSSDDGPRPRMPRVEVVSEAAVRVESNVYPARIENISQGGMKIECAAKLPLGPQVVVRIDGLEACRAVVRWKNGNFYGVTFNRVLPLPMLVSWLQDQREQLRAAS